MEFERIIEDVQVTHLKSFGDKGSRYRLDFFGGSQEFFAKPDNVTEGRHPRAVVKCRITGRDSYWIGVEIG